MDTLVVNAQPPSAAFPWANSTSNMIASATPTRSTSSHARSNNDTPARQNPSSSSSSSSSSLPARPVQHDGPSASQSTSRDIPPGPSRRVHNSSEEEEEEEDARSQRRHAHRSAGSTAASSPTSSHSDDSLTWSSVERVTSGVQSPQRIKVKSLRHIESFGSEELERIAQSQSPSLASLSQGQDQGQSVDSLPHFEISEMPVNDVIEMVAGLLTKITSTNDAQHAHMHSQIPSAEGAGLLTHDAQSVLSFHGKNIPSITILSYLSRIHKYCPATYEVFLSLLVYFDRMTSSINAGPLASLEKEAQEYLRRSKSESASVAAIQTTRADTGAHSSSSNDSSATPPSSVPGRAPVMLPDQPTPPSPPLSDSEALPLSQFFVVDSFNIHRLVIAGVTCASKFFSDVFYTNSRYAKVGGLPLPELNHLELQFLLLNEFKLSISVEELEAYATMLVAFYAREVISQRREASMDTVQQPGTAESVQAS